MGLQLVPRDAHAFHIAGIKERLCEHLPAYMIPSTWVVLHKLPMLPSGKLDRRQIDIFVDDINTETYQQIVDIENTNDNEPVTDVKRQLQMIWGKALNLPTEQIPLDRSFLHLGGDRSVTLAD
jgi:hypothetical protein